MKTMIKMLLLSATLGLAACNTAVGMGKDVIGAGRFVANQVFDDE